MCIMTPALTLPRVYLLLHALQGLLDLVCFQYFELLKPLRLEAYVPCCNVPQEHRNVPAGFAFVNFISPIDAWMQLALPWWPVPAAMIGYFKIHCRTWLVCPFYAVSCADASSDLHCLLQIATKRAQVVEIRHWSLVWNSLRIVV